VINPVLDTIEKTGVKTASSEKLNKLFKVKEGLKDAALEKADEAVLKNFDSLSSVEKIKSLRSSLYKEGSEDFIQTQFSDLHQKFIGKYSPSVGKANKSYGPMKQALRWGSKNIKPFHRDEIKRVVDIMQKEGGADETVNAYLNTLRKGEGEFQGLDITKLEEGHQKTLEALNRQIDEAKSMINRFESQNVSDVASVRQSGMESTLNKQNVLVKSAENKSKMAKLKQIKEQVDRDLKTRDDLIRWGIVAGLGSVGLGGTNYVVSKLARD